jgi:3',5'-cyclic AMP phosphodiesterase CpdA
VTVIAHVSDLHLSPVPFPTEWPWRLKPVLGWINWRRQLGAHDDAVWDRTAAAVLAAAPDFVAVTGDLIELGLSSEYARARAALGQLGDPAHVSWAPGNHDAYTTDTTARIRDQLGDWIAATAIKGDLRGHFPRLDRVGRAIVITLCSGTPTWTFSAEGALGASQLARLDTMLSGLDRAGHLPVIAIHHPPVAEGLHPLKRLRDGEALLNILARNRCPLVLHGHLHEACRREWRAGDHGVTLIGATSASATGRRGEEGPTFNLVTIAQDLSWSVETRPVA